MHEAPRDRYLREVMASSLFGMVDSNKLMNLFFHRELDPKDFIDDSEEILNISKDSEFIVISFKNYDYVIPSFLIKKTLKYLLEEDVSSLKLQDIKLRRGALHEAELQLDQASVAKSYFVNEVVLEVTRLCNLRCVHCLIPHELKEPSKASFMDLKLAKRAIRDARGRGANIVTITGGEPLLHPQLPDIISYARELLMIVLLNTNLTIPLSEEMVETLKSFGPTVSVKVSVYGLKPDVFKAFTKLGDSQELEIWMDNLRILKEAGTHILFSVFYTEIHKRMGVSPEDYMWLEEFGSIHFQNIRPGWGFMPPVRRIINWREEPDRINLSNYLKLFASPESNCPINFSPLIYVCADGVIYPCPFVPEVVSHIDDDRWFEDVMNKVTLQTLPLPGGRCNLLMEDGAVWKSRC